MPTHYEPVAGWQAPLPTEPEPNHQVGIRVLAAVSALVLAVTVWLVQHVAVQTARGQRLDDRLRDLIAAVPGSPLDRQAEHLGQASFSVAVVVALSLGLYALVRVRPDQLVVLGIAVGGANLATQLLKHVLIERPVLTESSPNSLPSGHMTIVASVVLATLLLTGGILRSVLLLLGAVWVVAMGAAVVVAGWHRPSDVLAALLVCGCFAALAVTVVGPGDRSLAWT